MLNSSYGNIACCICGTSIAPNQVNMCIACLKERVDITEGVSRSEVVNMCKDCGRFKGGAGKDARWLMCELESAELLALCLKTVHGLGKGKKNGATFVDAKWIWTEPHSRRLKIQVTVEKETFNNAMLRQNVVVEFVVKTQLCDGCTKATTDQQWTTVVQVRQQVPHKRTLLNLENILVKDGGARKALDIDSVTNGLDFYFSTRTLGLKFSDHILSLVPARRKESKKLQGADLKSNKYNFRHNIMIEVAPICKGDAIVLPLKLQHALFGGNVGFVLCQSVRNVINLIEPFTGQSSKLSETKYWQNAFQSLSTMKSSDLIEFQVLDSQPLDYKYDQEISGDDKGDGKSQDGEVIKLAQVEVARTSDFGVNDERFLVNSYFGGVLEPGDTVLGYDFVNHNFSDDMLKPLKGMELPSIVLVQKVHVKN